MKKALVFFIALAMIGSVFAAEPAAEVKVAKFTGNAAVTFGFNLDTVKAGFKNETSGKLVLNFVNAGDKATTGDGVWGELKIKVVALQGRVTNDKDFALITKEDNDSKSDIRVKIDTAKIHINDLYVGIKSGDFDYGGDFLYPNALNYDDGEEKDGYVSSPAKELGYNQGLLIGYEKKDLFKVEASVRSKKDDKVAAKTEHKPAVVASVSEKGKKYYRWDNNLGQEEEKTGDGTTTVANLFSPVATVAYTKDTTPEVPENYWTNKFAFGVYGEAKPIKDLRIGVGAAYVLGDAANPNDKDNSNDISLFAGVDYRFNLNEDFYIQPTVTYNLYNDYAVATKAYTLNTNKINAGLRFGFAKSKSSSDNSLLYDFFGQKKLFYEKTDNDKGDDMLLPGVSVFGSFDLTTGALEKNLPVMVTFYSGELVQNLKAYALFGANLGPKAKNGAVLSMTDAVYNGIIGKKGTQVGLAASYDIKIDDITIVPAAGVLWTHGTQVNGNDKMSANEVAVSLKADVKGLVSNTTFTVFWKDAAFGKGVSTNASSSFSPVKKGLIGLKAKIAL